MSIRDIRAKDQLVFACKNCGHPEIGIVTRVGEFIAPKPGDKVRVVVPSYTP